MAALEDFENTLKEVVNAKRLSASKMNRLTEIAMKSLLDDTRLVAILYRTHKSLPSAAKVSSLYAFDALARAARSLVNKHGVTGDIRSGKGNAATFLLKIEGVLDGLFQDMVSLGNSEAKEKTKKVLDIWAKSNTFPSALLTRLRDILSDTQKETAVKPPLPAEATKEAPATVTTPQPAPHAAPADVQATLLALLGRAAQITDHGQARIQSPPNTDPQLEQSQLALLQQLALTAKLANGSPTPSSGQTPPPPPPPPPTDENPSLTVLEPSRPSSWPHQTEGSHFGAPGDGRYAHRGYLDRPRDRHDFHDERHMRGGHRGGHRGRGRRDDRHGRDRFRHRDRAGDPPMRPRRSRSRSPRRPEEWRNARPKSPPPHPLDDREPPTVPASTPDKDEFGRDIRASPHSPPRPTPVEDTQTHAPMESSVDPTPGAPPDYDIPVSEQLPLVAASISAQSTETHAPSSASQQAGLDQFDISTFDATASASWEGLGNMWKTTYGDPPSQEELMHFVMAEGMAAAAGRANGGFDGAQGDQWRQGSWEDHDSWRDDGWRGGRTRGLGNAGGRGGHGNYRDEGGSEPTCAIVLEPSDTNDQTMGQNDTDEKGEPTSASGSGRMQRMGDKWVFVRDVETGPA